MNNIHIECNLSRLLKKFSNIYMIMGHVILIALQICANHYYYWGILPEISILWKGIINWKRSRSKWEWNSWSISMESLFAPKFTLAAIDNLHTQYAQTTSALIIHYHSNFQSNIYICALHFLLRWISVTFQCHEYILHEPLAFQYLRGKRVKWEKTADGFHTQRRY